MKFNASVHRSHRAVQKFEKRHNKPPDIILVYDDGDEHSYCATPTASKQQVILCDEEGIVSICTRTISPSSRVARGIIAVRGDERVAELALGAGAVGSSYDAEAFAAVQAFHALSELTIASGSTIRWFTDSRSCIDALNGQQRMYGEMMRQLREPN